MLRGHGFNSSAAPPGGHQACNARHPNSQHWAHEIIYQRKRFHGFPACCNDRQELKSPLREFKHLVLNRYPVPFSKLTVMTALRLALRTKNADPQKRIGVGFIHGPLPALASLDLRLLRVVTGYGWDIADGYLGGKRGGGCFYFIGVWYQLKSFMPALQR